MPSDWEPRPVYPIHHIPYHVAQYWDRGLRQQVEDKGAASRKKKAATAKGQVPRDLRDTLKKTPGVKGWVRTLEEPVRHFLMEQQAAEETTEQLDKSSESDFSDDEVVFVGRKSGSREAKAASAAAWKKAHREVRDRTVDHGMIFDSLEEDESGSFKYVFHDTTRNGQRTERLIFFFLSRHQALVDTLDIRLLWTRFSVRDNGQSSSEMCLYWHSRDGRATRFSIIKRAASSFVGAAVSLTLMGT